MNLYSEFQKLISALNRERIEYALCGGMAMAVYDLPREGLVEMKRLRGSGKDQDDIDFLTKNEN